MTAIITVAICDDHTLFRKSLAVCLKTVKRIKVLQDFADGSELVSYLECNELPAVVLLDIKMPIMDGYKTAACIKKHFPSIKIIAMSSFDNEFAVAQIIKKGADSFISKNAEPEEMYDAILNVHKQGFYATKWACTENNLSGNVLVHLTDKQKEMLPLLCSEKSYNEIADHLNISIKTVDRHRDEIFKKFRVQSRLNLALFAINNGIVV